MPGKTNKNFAPFIRLRKQIRTKEVAPRIYGVLVSDQDGTSGLHVVMAYDYDEAQEKAIHEFATEVNRVTGKNNGTARVDMWVAVNFEDLEREATEVTLDKIDLSKLSSKRFKNKLLNDIIERNDVELFNYVKGNLSEHEQQLVTDKLHLS